MWHSYLTYSLQLLLLLWKSLLACLGGHKDIKRVKRLVRKIEGLPKDFVDDSRKFLDLTIRKVGRL